MSAFTLDIKGQLNNMRLSTSKVLWPLFEAIVNSIHSIEDSANNKEGAITITAIREDALPMLDNDGQLKRIESFVIEDNGAGFNSQNYKSFNTAYSTLKVKKGCKGIGRFLWLKAFNSVDIESFFVEEEKVYKRSFVFDEDGITPEENVTQFDGEETFTKIKLNGFKPDFKSACPVELDVIAKKIVEHCLLYFLSENCPKIILRDGESTPVDLNEYFERNVKDSLHQDHFNIKQDAYVLYHLRVPEGANMHELHLCANMQEVSSIELKKYIPDLHRKITPLDDSIGFYYVGYITGNYLDSMVNTTRTGFDFDEKFNQTALYGTGKETLVDTAIGYIKTYLSDYIKDISEQKRKQIDDFVAYEKPTYRYLLNNRPKVYDKIPAGLSGDALDLELHKAVQEWEREIKIRGKELEEAIKSNVDKESYDKLFEEVWSGITEISKTSLAEYVARRKVILSMLEETLTIQENGRFKKEDAIHSIICPMRHTSNDINFEEMNLWIIDERLAYHQFLASDKTIKSLPEIDSSSTKELDIAVFDRAFAYTDDADQLNTITIVEFKKPDNTKDNPISQMGKYIDEIMSGRKKRASGLSFGDCSKTSFRCFAICDMTPKMETHCKDASLRAMPDGNGYYGYQPERNAYFEVISYTKLLADAKKRNQILFDKLFSTKVGEVIHKPTE